MMRLIPNWKHVLTRAWSIRLMALAMVFSAAEVALQLLTPAALGIPPLTFAALSGLCSAIAFATRLLAQKGLTPDANDR